MGTQKHTYWILSGEGVVGTWERVVTTERGIKLRLTKERCRGDRWAEAYTDVYETVDGCVAGYNVESGTPQILPEEARTDIIP
jgi:hypothetical protein